MITEKIKHISPPPKAANTRVITATRMVTSEASSGLNLEQADGRYRRQGVDIPLAEVSGLEGLPIARELILSNLGATGWVRLGRIDSTIPRVLRFDFAMIRGNSGQAAPSEYRLTVSVNSGTDSGVCYFGAQLNCIYGDDYDGPNDDPLLAIALVRRSGYGPRKADLLLKHEGSAFALNVLPSDPSGSFSWDPASGLSDPGTGGDVSIAKRHIIMYS